MTKKQQFKIIDLVIFSVLAMMIEFIPYQLLNVFDHVGFIVSFGYLLGLIAIFRWGLVGSVVYILGGLPLIFINDNYLANLLFYVVANIFIIVTPLIMKFVTREKIQTKVYAKLLFVLLPAIFVSVGKGLVIYLLDNHVNGFIDYFASQLFTLLITFIVLNIVSGVEGLLENMNEYVQD